MAPFDHIPSLLVAFLGSAVGMFVLAVLVDDALGIALALKHKAFDPHALKSFMLSQFGTREAIAEAGLIVTAFFAGGDTRSAVTAAATAGALAMTAAVIADIKAKVGQIAGA